MNTEVNNFPKTLSTTFRGNFRQSDSIQALPDIGRGTQRITDETYVTTVIDGKVIYKKPPHKKFITKLRTTEAISSNQYNMNGSGSASGLTVYDSFGTIEKSPLVTNRMSHPIEPLQSLKPRRH